MSEVIAFSVGELQRRHVVLRSALAEGLPPVLADRVQLQQVILNLLRNASDAMADVAERARQIVITTQRDEGDRVRPTVRDAGTGFVPGTVDRLFEAFFTTKTAWASGCR